MHQGIWLQQMGFVNRQISNQAFGFIWRLPKVPGTKLSGTPFDLFGPTGGLFWLDKKMKEETKKAKKKGKGFKPVTIIDKTYKI